MILIDSNVPMYLAGAPHPNKLKARHQLEKLVYEQQRLVTDAEVFQEILHRYVALQRRDSIASVFELLRGLVDEVFPVDLVIMEKARDIVLGYPRLSARDALHAAVMRQHGIAQIFSFDSDYDDLPGISRLA